MKKIKNYFVPSGITDQYVIQTLMKKNGFDELKCHKLCSYYTYILKNISNREMGVDEYLPIHHDIQAKFFGNRRIDGKYLLDVFMDLGLVERLDYNPHTGEYCPNGYYNYSGDENPNQSLSYRIPKALFQEGKLYRFLPVGTNQQYKYEKQLNTMNYTNLSSANDYYRKKVAEVMNEMYLLDCKEVRELMIQKYKEVANVVGGISSIAVDAWMDLKIASYSNPFSDSLVDAFGHRLHHSIVRLKKDFRAYLRHPDYPNEEYVNIDLVNSQPWFYANISEKLINLFAPDCSDAIPIIKKYKKHPDFKRFKKIADAGLIYETLCDLWEQKYAEPILKRGGESEEEYQYKLRKAAKPITFVAFYSNYLIDENSKSTIEDYEHMLLDMSLEEGVEKKEIEEKMDTLLYKKAIQLFRDEFNGVYQMFKEIKQLDWKHLLPENRDKKKRYSRYKNTALLVQRIESGVIFSQVVQHLHTAKISKVITFHDAVAVPASQAERAKKVVKKAFKGLGLNPKLST
jgi:hypothetical protein